MATAASIALPPWRRMASPASSAGYCATTIARRANTGCRTLLTATGQASSASTVRWISRRATSASLGLQAPGDGFGLAPDAKQVAAPHPADVGLAVAAAHELERDVERLRGAVPAVDAAAAVEVRRDADVLDADQLDGVVDVIDEVLDGGSRRSRELLLNLCEPARVLVAALGRETGGELCSPRRRRRRCGRCSRARWWRRRYCAAVPDGP